MKFQFCFNTLKTAFPQNVSEQIRNAQAVCVTTHKGSWVKLLMYLISVVTWSSEPPTQMFLGARHAFLPRSIAI